LRVHGTGSRGRGSLGFSNQEFQEPSVGIPKPLRVLAADHPKEYAETDQVTKPQAEIVCII